MFSRAPFLAERFGLTDLALFGVDGAGYGR